MSYGIRSKLGPALLVLAALSAAAVTAEAQAPAAVDLGAKVLPSLATLTVQTSDGRSVAGNGFLAIKDGILVTSWRVVRNARSVVARFSNGEEYECSGIVDKDEKRNVALVRIKVFGRPLLAFDAAELAPGSAVTVAAVKEGAFGLIPASVGEAAAIDDLRLPTLSGDLPEGTSGSPVVNARGEAVGLLATVKGEGPPAFFVLPAASVLGLDVTLPTQPWGAAAAPATGAAGSPALMAIEEVDARLGKALLAVMENETGLSWASELTRGYGFLNGVPDAVYQFQQGLDAATSALSEIRTDDELRLRTGRAVMQIMAGQKAASENFIRAVVVGQQAKSWIAQAQDAQKRSNSLRLGLTAQIAALKADLAALDEASPRFREFLPFEQRYLLGLAARPSGFRLGVTTYPRNPFYLLIVSLDGLAHKIGLRPGDLVISAAGRTFTAADDFEEFKLLIKANLGKTLPAEVERNGKRQTVKLKIPKEIPQDAFYAP